MKTRLSQICIAITMLLSVSNANAQHFGPGSGIGGQQSAFQSVQGDLLQPGLPGRLWFESNFADEGLGYNGSYLSLGGKTRLFQDRLDGRWLFEGQLNQSIEDDGGFFTTVGIERVFSVKPANADISMGVFYTYDGDDQQTFSDGFNQLGVSTAIKSRHVDFIANGYFPINTKAFTLGDPTGQQIFVGNNIALQAGIENALQGFDVTMRVRPKQLAFANGYIDFGGYSYDSEDNLTENLAGGRLRVGFQLINSLSVVAEVNQDDLFDTTGFLGATWTFGNTNSGYGSEYAGLARDLEQFSRNDHIVRFSQDLVVAINPLTGFPINVVHANNTQEGMGDGTFESPFATLAEAEVGSTVNDVIFVDVGDGTDTGYQNGITLQNNQTLLSSEGTQFVQNSDGTLIATSTDGIGATISNAGGNAVVTLANNNIVGGINIDATGANFGVFGSDITGGTFGGGTFNGVNISGATLDGIGLQNVAGNWNFNGNNISDNMRDGIFIDGTVGSDAVYTFDSNTVTGNIFDGIHLADYEADNVVLTTNTVSGQGRHGVYLENALDPNGNGTDIFVTSHLADLNGGNGVFIENGTGSVFVAGGTFTNNSAAGLAISNWRTDMNGDVISIAALDDGVAPTFTGNVMGVDINVDNGTTSTVNITEGTINGNARGVIATATGVGSTINLNVGGTTTLNVNANEAIAHVVDDGGTINSLIEGTAANRLVLAGNSSEGGINIDGTSPAGGAALSYLLDGDDPNNRSRINAIVRNVDVTSINGPALAVDGLGESVTTLLVEDSLLSGTAIGVAIDIDNNVGGEINRTFFDNVDIRGDLGVVANTQAGTLTDISITNSLIRSSGNLSENSPMPFMPGPNAMDGSTGPQLFGPFTDAVGTTGIIVNADGGGLPGVLISDNLTRFTLENSTVEDFTFNGIELNTTGDAQLLANLRANQILRNGPGFNDDGTTDNGVDDGPIAPTPIPSPNEGFFFNGLTVTANDVSTISLDVTNNFFLFNFDRSIVLTTNLNGTINANVVGNRFTGDTGVDTTMTPLDPFFGEIGVANNGGTVRLDLSSNAFNSVPVVIDAGSPAIFLGLDGLTNDFTAVEIGGVFTPIGFGLSEMFNDAEAELFGTAGFVLPDH